MFQKVPARMPQALLVIFVLCTALALSNADDKGPRQSDFDSEDLDRALNSDVQQSTKGVCDSKDELKSPSPSRWRTCLAERQS